jgi:FKBP-type peptidyl-prolyl cis-trans isomerase
VVQSNADKARFTSDTTAIEKFLADHNIDAETDGSGVRYVITEQGSGAMPEWFSKVKFKYSGTNLVTSTEFSSGTSEPTDSFDSRLADYINGMKVALMKLNVGGKITAYIPSGLAFGPQENSTILLPANSNVKYEIELLEIIP